MKYIPNDYQNYIALSRYARWIEEEGRRETWEETVRRYVTHFSKLFPDYPTEEIYNGIVALKVMPSMRAMMSAGKALEKCSVPGYNCFSGDETFITTDGIRNFVDTVDQKVTVLTNKGWREARVQEFGVQKLQSITFRPSKSKSTIRKSVKVTPNHRWITSTGVTTNIQVGDCVASSVVEDFEFIPEAFIQGFGFGDGTIDNRGRALLRLCGDKVEKWKSVFDKFGHASIWTPKNTENEDVIIAYHVGYFENWKSIPNDHIDNIDWLSSWLSGYLAADGHSDPIQPGLSSQNDLAIQFVEKIAPICGYIVTGKTMETNYGTRKNPLVKLTLRKESPWYVTNIEELEEDTVYCVVEPETQTFTLGSGILTGNCSYVVVDNPRAFDETLYILMAGTGVGFSVERQYIAKLPTVPEELYDTDTVIVVDDSRIGWAKSLKELISLLYAGQIPKWDVSKLRPAGARLKTFGGRSSGPEPLVELFKFVVKTFKKSVGRKLNSVECHDIMCMIASIVVSGGVRRSALISLSNLSDDRMRNAKTGNWWELEQQRALANNSVAYTEKPDINMFMREWLSLQESGSGERGIFNRVAVTKKAKKDGRRDTEGQEYGGNPCLEIILRSNQFCNLSEVVIRETDTLDDLKEKVKLATIIGTYQSMLTDFKYIRSIWKKNAEEERLLGVSLTGISDHPVLGRQQENILGFSNLKESLTELKNVAIETNEKLSKELGINQSVAISTIKPSGTVSQLVDSASGIHPRFSKYYIRTVRSAKTDPLSRMLKDMGVPSEDDVTNSNTVVFSFPMKSPESALLVDELTAIKQLEQYLLYRNYWCEHNVSITVYVESDEWLEVGAWVYKNFDNISGVSFLPKTEHTYRQAPYQEIDEATYNVLVEKMPKIDWDKLVEYELEDSVENTRELACVAGVCEI